MNVSKLTGIFALPVPKPTASRRGFLKISGGVGAGLILGLAAPLPKGAGIAATAEAKGAMLAPNPFVIVAPDNTVTVVVKQPESFTHHFTG